MKKNIFLFLNIFMFCLFLNTTLAHAEDLVHEIRLGSGSGDLTVSGYEDAVLNDNAYYPSATGGTFIEFSEANQTSSLTQLNIGYSYALAQKHFVEKNRI